MNDKDYKLAIEVKEVGKVFKLPQEKNISIKSSVINFYKPKKYIKQVALNNITFNVKEGEFFGIVGRNGSGKSTLLKMLAGIYNPTSGSIVVNGKLTPFIELGVGFNPELTGRENIFLNGALLGFNRKEMQKMYNDIVDFAELHNFMDQKLKNYSSGMQVRLAFSIATRVDSDILVLDEVLAVGDASFQRKCFDYFMYLKKIKRTVILVTHDMAAVRQYCDRAIMIENGRLVVSGSPERVAQSYQKVFLEDSKNAEDNYKYDDNLQDKRWGTKKILTEKTRITVSESKLIINCSFKAHEDTDPPIFGFTIYGPTGSNILECSTSVINYKTKPMKLGDRVNIIWEVPNIFANGNYSITIACCDESKTEFYDWFNEAGHLSIDKGEPTGGIVKPNIILNKYSIEENND